MSKHSEYCHADACKGCLDERDAILRERAAYVKGVDARFRNEVRPDCLSCVGEFHLSCASVIAARIYPLPRVTRPRVASDPCEPARWEWRFDDGALQFRIRGEKVWNTPRGGEAAVCVPYADRVKLWASLMERSIETVEDDA